MSKNTAEEKRKKWTISFMKLEKEEQDRLSRMIAIQRTKKTNGALKLLSEKTSIPSNVLSSILSCGNSFSYERFRAILENYPKAVWENKRAKYEANKSKNYRCPLRKREMEKRRRERIKAGIPLGNVRNLTLTEALEQCKRYTIENYLKNYYHMTPNLEKAAEKIGCSTWYLDQLLSAKAKKDSANSL